ncbi:DNA recombination protein RecO [Bacillus sp. DX4.1]|uniref:DNA recombination protein RecO n=1 Tax=Bacillus sp. DX4.1 TaxID=3055867 RepID=UPI0025A1AD22|nr:DNA recombination protein RecO [Bacillus sp. DX4.1]MDM5189907.1 DNA recombination protein RecO [Bacillus sp. DX4.1]
MLWLILFIPAVMVWIIVLFVQLKSGKSNHHCHEPLIFYSQRISPFPTEKTEKQQAYDIKKSYRKR